MDRTNRKFFMPILMGAGDSSLADCFKLHKKLDDIFELMGNIQKPSRADSVEEAIYYKKQYDKNTLLFKQNVLQIISDLGITPEELIGCDFYKTMLSWNKFLDEELNSKKASD